MAGDSGRGRKRGPWRGLASVYDGILTGFGYSAGFIVLGMTLAIGIDVLVRAITGRGLRALVDIVEYAMLVATFAGAPWVLNRNGHVVIDLVVSMLPTRPQLAVRRLGAAIGMAVCALLTIVGIQAAHEAAIRGSLVFKGIIFPEWWALAVVPAGMALCAVEFARLIVRPQAAAWQQERS